VNFRSIISGVSSGRISVRSVRVIRIGSLLPYLDMWLLMIHFEIPWHMAEWAKRVRLVDSNREGLISEASLLIRFHIIWIDVMIVPLDVFMFMVWLWIQPFLGFETCYDY